MYNLLIYGRNIKRVYLNSNFFIEKKKSLIQKLLFNANFQMIAM